MKKTLFLIFFLILTSLIFYKHDSTNSTKSAVVKSVDSGIYILETEDGQSVESNQLYYPSSEVYPPRVGDKVFINGDVVIEYNRSTPLFFLVLLFVGTILFVAKQIGLNALLSLAASITIILIYILPAIVKGYDPIFVSLTGGILIMFFSLFTTHGFNKKTSISFFGILISLFVGILLSLIFTKWMHISGYVNEDAVFLKNAGGYDFDLISLLLAGIIIGSLGVLDDVCVSQASLVNELAESNPKMSKYSLYKRSMKVGVDHVSSVVNTLALAYTASMLPLLLLFVIEKDGGYGINYFEIINNELIITEIVRILISSIAIIIAVPITTFIASRQFAKN